VAREERGLEFRDVALEAAREAYSGSAGALAAADRLLAAAADYRKSLARRLKDELSPFSDPRTGAPLDQYRGAVRRLQQRHHRMERRAERDFLDWSLVALEAWFRDALLLASGGHAPWVINLDRASELPAIDPADAARGVAVLEEARAALADETNLNPRLVLERAFLRARQSGE
jgi:hypothetical protein